MPNDPTRQGFKTTEWLSAMSLTIGAIVSVFTEDDNPWVQGAALVVAGVVLTTYVWSRAWVKASQIEADARYAFLRPDVVEPTTVDELTEQVSGAPAEPVTAQQSPPSVFAPEFPG